ncbi:MAG: YbjN domain-containing protein [Deltaproteobacteria bacterium]|jgi:hypothetical protein|nr:YbjN domain-containing protein [Deltaproteobacteria bacterium]
MSRPRFSPPTVAVFVAVILALFPVLPAAAQGDVYQKITPDQLFALMHDQGYDVSLGDSVNGGKLINWEIDGFTTVILFFDGGLSIQFYGGVAGGGPSLDKINAFNRDYRFSRTYLDSKGDPNLELDLDLEGGVTRGRILDYLITCRLALANWLANVIAKD